MIKTLLVPAFEFCGSLKAKKSK